MKLILTLFTCLFVTGCAYAQNFSDYFTNKTLRVDYLFTGNTEKQSICLDELSELPTWAGRRHHLAELPLEGNGQIVMRDVESGKAINLSRRTFGTAHMGGQTASSCRITTGRKRANCHA